MKAPKFWSVSHPTMASSILSPLGRCYNWAVQQRHKKTSPYQSKLPVICVGNFTMGGAGKTPLTASLYKILKKLGFTACILSRGYKGTEQGPYLINSKTDSYDKTGDEPLMLAQYFPVVISKDRVKGAQYIEELNKYDLILMDDGFQNPTLKKDLNIIAYDNGVGLGNKNIFPAGPLREDIETACKRADLLIPIGPQNSDFPTELTSLPKITGKILPIHPLNRDQLYLPFCGIGRPLKFLESLQGLSLPLLDLIDFPDHHEYTEEDLLILLKKAQEKNAILLTTEKDWIKFSFSWRQKISYMPIKLTWDHEDQIELFLREALK